MKSEPHEECKRKVLLALIGRFDEFDWLAGVRLAPGTRR